MGDLTHNNKASLTMSLAQGNYCAKNDYDPEDPRCAHVILTGEFIKLILNLKRKSLLRKPCFLDTQSWMIGLKVIIGSFPKINIKNILILDYFGGAVTVPVADYFNAKP